MNSLRSSSPLPMSSWAQKPIHVLPATLSSLTLLGTGNNSYFNPSIRVRMPSVFSGAVCPHLNDLSVKPPDLPSLPTLSASLTLKHNPKQRNKHKNLPLSLHLSFTNSPSLCSFLLTFQLSFRKMSLCFSIFASPLTTQQSDFCFQHYIRSFFLVHAEHLSPPYPPPFLAPSIHLFSWGCSLPLDKTLTCLSTFLRASISVGPESANGFSIPSTQHSSLHTVINESSHHEHMNDLLRVTHSISLNETNIHCAPVTWQQSGG